METLKVYYFYQKSFRKPGGGGGGGKPRECAVIASNIVSNTHHQIPLDDFMIRRKHLDLFHKTRRSRLKYLFSQQKFFHCDVEQLLKNLRSGEYKSSVGASSVAKYRC